MRYVGTKGWMRLAAVAAGLVIAQAGPAAAQTLTLPAVKDATVRGGSYANTNFGSDAILETRQSDSDEYVRRAVLTFDTDTTLPAGASIGTAQLVLTVKGGNSETRQLRAYSIPISFDEPAVTWDRRKIGIDWTYPGVDVVDAYATATATSAAGSKVTFDVTRQVQTVEKGTYGSRYARFLIADMGGSSRDSYRQYYSAEASNASDRPTLIVTSGSGTSDTGSGDDLTLTDGNATTLRAGSYANTNYGSSGVLETRASDSGDYVRRALLKFDTDTTTKPGASVKSAYLTITVAGGNPETRQLAVYRETDAYTESVATWSSRRSGQNWGTAGGDLAERIDVQPITNVAGSKVTFDVTSAVQKIVRGDYGSSRYTHFVLVDEGGSSRQSYKQIYSDEASATANRPTLTVTLGSGTSSTEGDGDGDSGSGSSGTSTLRVLQWNTHHGGYGTDGKYDPNRLASWIVKINPDIVSLNEIEYYTGWGNEDQPARYASLLESKTGKTWYYKFVTATGASKGNGNLILSRYPFRDTGTEQLSYSRAVVEASVVVNGRTISFFSTHLDADSSSYRLREVGELQAWAAGISEQRIVAGDFNAHASSAEIAKMTDSYTDTWAHAVNNGTAVAYADNPTGNTRNSRIDYIFASHGATKLTLTKVQVFDVRDANGVMPSDHRPVMATFTVK
ncbi:MAG TPA: DNRLRE domain-containing protein [Vicinamibacterales bacterium]|nr:DNRLRE domain-containing protein [Vicinamibacterales bacterium]